MHVAVEARFQTALRPRPSVTPEPEKESWTTASHILAIAERADRSAFTLLFTRYAPRIKAVLIRRGAAPAAAEELAQEAMLNVWRKAASFDPARGTGEAWIFTIARNVAIDARRRDRGAPPVAFEFETASEPVAMSDELVEAAQASDRLRAAIRELPKDQLDVIRQSFFEDRSHGEIAEALDLPLGTVKSRLRLAVARLRNLVGELK